MCRHVLILTVVVGFLTGEIKAEEILVKSHTSIAKHLVRTNNYYGKKRFTLAEVWRGRKSGIECGLVLDAERKVQMEVMYYNGRFGAVGETLGFKENWMAYCN